MLKIDFNNQYVPQNFIDIESIGNVCIEAINEEDGLFYYLLIKTSLGVTSIFEYGPIIPETTKLFDNYSVNFIRQPFNENKLKLFFKKWINDKSKKITSACNIEEQSFVDNYKDILYTINKYGKETY